MRLFDKIKQHTIYTQFVPTNKDLDSKELKELSKRLNADSENKTLINILEWQDRNLKFWEERWNTSTIITVLIILSWFIMLAYLGKNSGYLYGLTPVLIILLIIGNFE